MKKYQINNVDCVNCVNKLESVLNKDKKIKSAAINFTTRTLNIDTTYDFDELNKVVDKIEKGTYLSNKEDEKKEKKKFPYSLVLKIALIAILITLDFTPINKQLLLGISLITYVYLGWTIFVKAYNNLKQKIWLDENTLMIIATVAAFLIGESTEAVLILAFYQVGEYFQEYAVDKSRTSITGLIDSRPQFVQKKNGENIEEVPIKEVQIGDVLLIAPHELISLDCTLQSAESYVDTANLTGESVERKVKKGEEILSGVINGTDAIIVEVKETFDNSYLSKIIELIEESGLHKSRTEQFMTKFAKVYTPTVVIISVFVVLIQYYLFNFELSDAIYSGTAFLVVSCPCALVISIPLGYFGGIGLASKNDILIKGSNYLEAVNNVSDVVFDKTGTLTNGEFVIINSVSTIDANLFQGIVKSIEMSSKHIIARALVRELKADTLSVENVNEELSLGISGDYEGHRYKIGTAKYTNSEKIDTYNNVVYVSCDDIPCGYIELGDRIKEEAPKVINYLIDQKIETHILSGDEQKVVDGVSENLKIDQAKGNFLVDEKITELNKILKKAPKQVLYIGDGVNDSPSLKRADVGISLGNATNTVAIESSDIVFSGEKLDKLRKLFTISSETKKVIIQNIVLALSVKAIILLLATSGNANLYEAIFADVGVTIIAILNSGRLIRKEI